MMLYLDKKHDPAKNRNLLAEVTGQRLDFKKALAETDQLFQQNSAAPSVSLPSASPQPKLPFFQRIKARIFRFFYTIRASSDEPMLNTTVDEMGNPWPEWKPLLDEEYLHLMNIVREVNVADFGAVGDGITDCTEAFEKAFGNGRVIVHVPEGTYITKGIRLPSFTGLIGKGKGVTTIKLHEKAPKGTRLVTNFHHRKGNRNILVEGMSLDWNVERLGTAEKTSTWGNHSSCLTFANVSYGWVKNVEGINPGLHCFDISSTLYNYSGDGFRARGGSQYVWLDLLNGYGFGDDGITTHHSDNILITNCHMCDPSGRAHKKGFSNSNGIEVDDGSKNVWLVNNSSTRCFGGVEIKAHATSSAACNVQIIGHLSVNDNRSYNFRHIGHHKSTDPESKTAYNIKATNLAALAPIYTDLYKDSEPRGLVVSAYKNVAINHFTLIGDPEYDYRKNPVIAVQYRSRNVGLHNVNIRHFKKAGIDIKVFGGDNHPEDIAINNIIVHDSAPQAIHIGSGILTASIQNIRATGKNGKAGLVAEQPGTLVSNFRADGYKISVSIAGDEAKTIS